MNKFSIYINGKCQCNPGLGAWAFIILKNNKFLDSDSGFESSTTNDRVKMISLFHGLGKLWTNYLIQKNSPINIYSDSQLLINTITKRKERSYNLDLWEIIDKQLYEFNESEIILNFTKIKGQHDNYWNTRVNELVDTEMNIHIQN